MIPDLSNRAHLEEAMDAVEDFPTYRRCLHDLDSVSRFVLAHRPTLNFLNRIGNLYPNQSFRILDVACGDGSILRRIARWAAKRRIDVQLTGIDLNPNAIAVAHEFPTHGITYLVGDVFTHIPEPTDLILSAHFTHHLPDPDLIRFLQWMERHARIGWFVNDLHRHPNPYRLFRLLTRIAPWHPITSADGLISIRRAFTRDDWTWLLAAAGLSQATVQEKFPARLTVSRIHRGGLN